MGISEAFSDRLADFTSALDSQMAELPGIGRLFARNWQILTYGPAEGFSLLDEEGVREIAAEYGAGNLTRHTCLRLGPGQGQVRSLSLPRAASGNLREAVRLSLETISPMPVEDTAFAIVDTARSDTGENVIVSVAVASKARLQRMEIRAQEAGVALGCVDVLDPTDSLATPRYDLRSGHSPAQGMRPSILLAALCALMLVGAGLLHGLARFDLQPKWQALAASSSAQAPKASQMQRQARQEQTPFVQVWAEITRLLPDTAFADSLQMQGNVVRISGHADNAAALVPLLGASPMLTNVRFAAASVQGDDGRESFEIEAQVSPAPEGRP